MTPDEAVGSGECILVVDDDQAIRNLIAVLLRRQGIEVETAADGLEAALKLGIRDYSLVVLDLMMPLVSGTEILQFLAAEKPEILPRIIVMTAASERDIGTIGEYAIGPVVRKPFDISEFMRIIRTCLGRTG